MASKILAGDEVLIIHGKDKGMRSKVRQNLIREEKIIVEGANIVRKHVPRQANVQQGGIIEVEAPLHKSKVMVVCPSCDVPSRVGFRFEEDGTKVRYCKSCDAVIPRPDFA